jgi:hypothetical protein
MIAGLSTKRSTFAWIDARPLSGGSAFFGGSLKHCFSGDAASPDANSDLVDEHNDIHLGSLISSLVRKRLAA